MTIDADRWAVLDELISKANASGKKLTAEQVTNVVALNEHKIFTLSEDGLRIRCI